MPNQHEIQKIKCPVFFVRVLLLAWWIRETYEFRWSRIDITSTDSDLFNQVITVYYHLGSTWRLGTQRTGWCCSRRLNSRKCVRCFWARLGLLGRFHWARILRVGRPRKCGVTTDPRQPFRVPSCGIQGCRLGERPRYVHPQVEEWYGQAIYESLHYVPFVSQRNKRR